MKRFISVILSVLMLFGANALSCSANAISSSGGGFVEYESGSMGYSISEDSGNIIESIRIFDSPDKEKYVSVYLDSKFLPGDSAELKFVFDNKIVAVGAAPIPFGDVVVWVDNNTAVLLSQYILDANSGKVEKINFGNLSRLKGNSHIYDNAAQELIFDAGDASTVNLIKSKVSPDGKNILYICEQYLYETDRMCRFYALYEIKTASFRIIHEQIYDYGYFDLFTGPFTGVFYAAHDAFWKDNNTVVVKFSVEDEIIKTQSISVNIKTCEVKKFLEWESYATQRVVSAMSADGKYWITEAYEPITHCITVSLESEDGLKYKLYEERKDRTAFSFINNRYFEVKYPKEKPVSTIYDLENWVMFKIDTRKLPHMVCEEENAAIELCRYIDSDKLYVRYAVFSSDPYSGYGEFIRNAEVSFDLIPFFMKNAEVLSSWAKNEVTEAEELNLIPRELQSAYQKNCTREEFCTLILRLLERRLGKTRYEICKDNKVTKDPTAFRDTLNEDILRANALGIVNGVGERMFDPEGEITREQAATMLMRAAKVLGYDTGIKGNSDAFSDSANISGWATDAVSYISLVNDKENGMAVMGGVGDNAFSPKTYYTRQQAFITMKRLYNAK